MRSHSAFLLQVNLFAGMLTSNVAYAREVPMTSIECTIMRIAERHIAVHYPEFDSIKNPPILEDAGNFWRVYYQLPEGVMGGTPEVIIEKHTLQVLRAYRTQ